VKRAAVDLTTFFKAEFTEHNDVARRTEAALSEAFEKLVLACATSIRAGGKLMFFGNGGSAADAQHLATELTVRYKKDRAGNDLGFEKIFARQIEALGRIGDVAVAISTSGKSANVIAGLKQAKTMGLVTAAFGANDGGAMPTHADHLLLVPSATTARIQEIHILLGQMLCGALEIELGLAAGR
jgi:D-sedoheptulose 7-phosphate isomerase